MYDSEGGAANGWPADEEAGTYPIRLGRADKTGRREKDRRSDRKAKGSTVSVDNRQGKRGSKGIGAVRKRSPPRQGEKGESDVSEKKHRRAGRKDEGEN